MPYCRFNAPVTFPWIRCSHPLTSGCTKLICFPPPFFGVFNLLFLPFFKQISKNFPNLSSFLSSECVCLAQLEMPKLPQIIPPHQNWSTFDFQAVLIQHQTLAPCPYNVKENWHLKARMGSNWYQCSYDKTSMAQAPSLPPPPLLTYLWLPSSADTASNTCSVSI